MKENNQATNLFIQVGELIPMKGVMLHSWGEAEGPDRKCIQFLRSEHHSEYALDWDALRSSFYVDCLARGKSRYKELPVLVYKIKTQPAGC